MTSMRVNAAPHLHRHIVNTSLSLGDGLVDTRVTFCVVGFLVGKMTLFGTGELYSMSVLHYLGCMTFYGPIHLCIRYVRISVHL